jgi:trans-2,3-dihydro-3-hydroxyanthranilate isomerase
MPQSYAFETVDVFTNVRFGGNPLAVFTDARGLTTEQMQKLAFEFNLSETTFILPPNDPANTARVRIFTPQNEMPFAGHPSVGTAFVIARNSGQKGNELALEMQAGLVAVALERDSHGVVLGGKINAPLPLELGDEIDIATIAACAGLDPSDIITTTHKPRVASVGARFVMANVSREALARAVPDVAAMRHAIKTVPALADGLLLHLHAEAGAGLHVRMFAPLSGVYEDPATGSANAALGALLLHASGGNEAAFTISQGSEMGRPSTLYVTATRTPAGITASVAGQCVPIMRGEAFL